MTNRAVITRRIRRRAAQFKSFKSDALALQTRTLADAIADAESKGKTIADVRARIVEQLGECWRNLASRKREVRQLPHMRKYHTQFAIGELAVIRLAQRYLAEIDAMPRAEIFMVGDMPAVRVGRYEFLLRHAEVRTPMRRRVAMQRAEDYVAGIFRNGVTEAWGKRAPC